MSLFILEQAFVFHSIIVVSLTCTAYQYSATFYRPFPSSVSGTGHCLKKKTIIMDNTATSHFVQSFTSELNKFKIIKIGDLFLPTGNIVASDAMFEVESNVESFTKIVKPGKYPFIIYENEFQEKVYVELKISEEPVIKWEIACKEGQNEVGNYGFGVDFGYGCLIDMDTYNKSLRDTAIYQSIQNTGNRIGDYNECFIFQHSAGSEDNHAVFMPGTGEGGNYMTYIGLDKNNYPVKFVIDISLG